MIQFSFSEYQHPELELLVPIEALEGFAPRLGELAAGLERGWIDRACIVKLELGRMRHGETLTEAETQVALLLSDELDNVSEILRPFSLIARESDLDYWLFVFLVELYDRRDTYASPWRMIEMIYDAFGHPESMESFVPYMPPPEGQPFGESFQLASWLSYIERSRRRFASRDPDLG